MSDYSFIKEFQDIKLSKICKEFNINLGNLLSGGTSEENYKKVKNEIIRQLLMLIIKNDSEHMITLALYDEVILKLEKENKALKELI